MCFCTWNVTENITVFNLLVFYTYFRLKHILNIAIRGRLIKFCFSVSGVKQASHISTSEDYYRPSLLKSNHIYRGNDYDDYSGGVGEPRTPMQFWYPAPPYTDAQAPVKVYKPREDPRLYYQSDQYLKEVLGKNINHEVTKIYPGREVVRMDEAHLMRPVPIRRLRSRHDNRDFTG